MQKVAEHTLHAGFTWSSPLSLHIVANLINNFRHDGTFPTQLVLIWYSLLFHRFDSLRCEALTSRGLQTWNYEVPRGCEVLCCVASRSTAR